MKKLLLLLITLSPLAYSQQAPVSPDTIIQQIKAAYSSDTSVEQRVAIWKPIIDAWAEGGEENKKQIVAFLERIMSERLGLRITSKNTDIAVLINFLKTFSKEEALYILHIWIQANTNPKKVNGIYAPPETFMKNRVGDCTEVAWLAEIVCRELDIETKVFLAQYELKYSLRNYIDAHAFTGLEFTENNTVRRYIIDNRNLYELSPDNSWKNIVWQIYSQQSQVWRYREVNTTLWRTVRKYSDDTQMMASNMFVIFAPIPREEAIKEFTGYELTGYFDDPAQEILFFRDDYQKTISAQKETGEISEEEYNRLYKLWRKYENFGWRK
jgi:hypothetical protein